MTIPDTYPSTLDDHVRDHWDCMDREWLRRLALNIAVMNRCDIDLARYQAWERVNSWRMACSLPPLELPA